MKITYASTRIVFISIVYDTTSRAIKASHAKAWAEHLATTGDWVIYPHTNGEDENIAGSLREIAK